MFGSKSLFVCLVCWTLLVHQTSTTDHAIIMSNDFNYSLTNFFTRFIETFQATTRSIYESSSSSSSSLASSSSSSSSSLASSSSSSSSSLASSSNSSTDVSASSSSTVAVVDSNEKSEDSVTNVSDNDTKSKSGKVKRESSEVNQLNQELATNPLDPNSFARSSESLKVFHLHLSLFIDFKQKLLEGYVRLSVSRKPDKNNNHTETKLLLDTYELDIVEVVHVQRGTKDGGKEDSSSKPNHPKVPFKLYQHLPKFGSKLELDIGTIDSKHSKFEVQIRYRTLKDGTKALTWMEAEQTDAKRQPFMFTQCEPNYARTMLPCQDTPGVKTPYTAEMKVDNPNITVLMSGVQKGSRRKDKDGLYLFNYEQTVPIPSYLIAIVAGDLVSAQISARSKVWSENYTPPSPAAPSSSKSTSSAKSKSKSLIEKVAWEFAQIESMLTTAESIVGRYEFVRYDLLVLPSSFAFGGMENPCLTFVSNTLLAGDRSLVSVVAHEIAHSWFGNLVTNRNFEHFWLNEGFTTFLERKIVDRCCSTLEREVYRHFAAIDGLQDMTDDIEKFISRKKQFATSLVVDLRGHEPEEAFSRIPYDKGHTFLFYLEELVGGPKVFDLFLKQYVKQYRLQSIDSDIFRNYFLTYFRDKQQHSSSNGKSKSKSKSIDLDSIDWDKWLYGQGMPPQLPHYNQALVQQCCHLAQEWFDADFSHYDETSRKFVPEQSEPASLAGSAYRKLLPKQRRCFFNELRKLGNADKQGKKRLEVKRFRKLYHNYQLGEEQSLEIRTSFVLVALDIRSEDQIEDAFKLIQETGRMKYVVPVYRGLFVWDKTRSRVVNYFKQNRLSMMKITAEAIEGELEISK